jgi:DNA-binding ferritin-like protein
MKKKASPDCLRILQVLLASLRAAHLLHWAGHWQAGGDTQYGDHLLLERIYTGLEDHIDTLAEKIVSEYEAPAVDPIDQAKLISELTCSMCDTGCESVPERSLKVEEDLQKLLKSSYEHLKTSGQLSLGMDDYLMATANDHDTFVYLLRQRVL